MQFSVIIPAYNRAAFISRALRSVADQDCVDRSSVEILVVDDGSTDGTADVAGGVDVSPCHLDVTRRPHCGEPGTTRNVALRKARGEYIAYCDSDDLWLPHHLATAMQAFRGNEGLMMVANYWALAQFVVRPGGAIENKIVVPTHPTWAVNTNCRVHKRSCLEKVKNFNKSRWGEDTDFFQRIEDNYPTTKTGIVTSINGYIKGGNNLTYDSDLGIKGRYF